MGGARCTYRNCTVKSDGQTHIFHYPVFDKVRCHQWLINAHRLEFLDLKVSQLKNRVVCQYHFKPECFMNYKMDKLTYDAVPTENGPFCKEEDWLETHLPEAAFPINVEDIENDQLTYKDKKANMSVKYGDFLINSEMDPVPKVFTGKVESTIDKYPAIANSYPIADLAKNQSQNQPFIELPSKTLDHNNDPNHPKIEIQVPPLINYEFAFVPNKTDTNVNNRVRIISEKKLSKPLKVKRGKIEPVPPTIDISRRNMRKNIVQDEIRQHTISQTEKIETEDVINSLENMGLLFNNMQDIQSNVNATLDPPQNSQMVLTEQSPFIINEKHSATSDLLQNSQMVLTEQSPFIINEKHSATSDPPQNSQMVLTEQSPFIINEKHSGQSENMNPLNPISTNNVQNNKLFGLIDTTFAKTSNQLSPKMTFKNKIPPERVAEIEEKRKFNKKLRDMIEVCLDELDDTDKKSQQKAEKNRKLESSYQPPKSEPTNQTNYKTIVDESMIKEIIKKRTANEANTKTNIGKKNKSQNSELLKSNESVVSKISEFNIASLEARLMKMESLLLQKIEQNSQKILDLKNSVLKPTALKPSLNKITIPTQTKEDEETYKKGLYKEISVFLSPEVNSVVYEELFLNKYAKQKNQIHEEVSQAPKRRRRR